MSGQAGIVQQIRIVGAIGAQDGRRAGVVVSLAAIRVMEEEPAAEEQ